MLSDRFYQGKFLGDVYLAFIMVTDKALIFVTPVIAAIEFRGELGKMKLRSKLLAGLVSATCIVALGACGTTSSDKKTSDGSAEKGTVRVWLVSTDTPQAARDYLTTTFEKENPGSKLVIEQQEWDGLVDKYTTSLSGSDSPDVVEIGNTQAVTFTSIGAFQDLTDKKADLGGDAMLESFVEDGTWDGKLYAVPYYAGARVVTYSSDVVPSKYQNPKTWDEFLANAKAMTTSKVSGLYMPGKDWHDFLTFVMANGGYIAKQQSDGTWKAGFEDPNSIKGLQQLQDMYKTANNFAADATESDNQIPFCAGQTAYMMAPSWLLGSVEAAPDANPAGCSTTYGNPKKVHQFAIPGATEGTFAPVISGGSNLAISAKSPHPTLAYKALKIMLSDGYQKILAQNGMVPALTTQSQYMPKTEASQAALNAAQGAFSTPAAPNWANVESSKDLETAFMHISQGQDVTAVAKTLDSQIDKILNQS
jgi:N,N'-diacetylchitobiose transport system substrate-binding protein